MGSPIMSIAKNDRKGHASAPVHEAVGDDVRSLIISAQRGDQRLLTSPPTSMQTTWATRHAVAGCTVRKVWIWATPKGTIGAMLTLVAAKMKILAVVPPPRLSRAPGRAPGLEIAGFH